MLKETNIYQKNKIVFRKFLKMNKKVKIFAGIVKEYEIISYIKNFVTNKYFHFFTFHSKIPRILWGNGKSFFSSDLQCIQKLLLKFNNLCDSIFFTKKKKLFCYEIYISSLIILHSHSLRDRPWTDLSYLVNVM